MRRTLCLAGLTLAARILPAQPLETPDTWGPATGYTTIMNYRLQGTNAIGSPYTLFHQGGAGTSCHGDPAAECLGYAQIEVPDGARLELIGIWGYDDAEDSDLHWVVMRNCETVPPESETVVAQGDIAQSEGNFLAAAGLNEETVNNKQCGYTVRLRLTDPGDPPAGFAIRVRKVAIVWTRQVSPPPAAATFNDVPTSHPFFQFVEALSRSGITAGCSAAPPLYCPDEPLTRGQMAVFLAKALGLQWPLPLSE